MDLHTVPTHRFMQKLHKFRKREQHILPPQALAPQTVRHDNTHTCVLPPRAADDHSIHRGHHTTCSVRSLPDSLPDPDDPLLHRIALPTYTPVPVPARISSALREHENLTRSIQSEEISRDRHGANASTGSDEQHGVVDFSGFNDDLIQQQESPSPRRGRLRPAMPGILRDQEARQPRHIPSIEGRLASRPAPAAASNSNAPPTLSESALAQLQTPSPDQSDILNTKLSDADDPESWDVVKSGDGPRNDVYSLEKRSEQLYSAEHLRVVLEDPNLLVDFTSVLQKCRPWRMPLLTHYLSLCKALRALKYANALAKNVSTTDIALLPGGGSAITGHAVNLSLQDAAKVAFEALLKDDLHYFIADTWIEVVSKIVQRRITGTLPARLRETSNGLAEVFCITDPKRRDNPIILASEAFTRHSGCSLEYVLGRNCRFMQGPGTTIDSCRRFAISCQEARDHTELLVNYRRDGSPLLSMVMNAPLIDSQGNVRYFLGAQVDVSGLLRDCSGLESLRRVIENQATEQDDDRTEQKPDPQRHFQALCQMFSEPELDIVRKSGGALYKSTEQIANVAVLDRTSTTNTHSRVILEDDGDIPDLAESQSSGRVDSVGSNIFSLQHKEPSGIAGNLAGVYQYYLLIRPAPSLRILFASPTMRVPGILQSRFLDRIGGSAHVREDLETALRQGEAVTARIRWLTNPDSDGLGEGKTRWVHCTPLKHFSGAVGLWMVVMVMPSPGESVGSRLGSVSRFRA